MLLSDPALPRRRLALTAYRVVVALLIFAAVVTEIATLVERDRFVPANFFSFFTIESNLFASAVLLLSVLAPRHGRTLILLRGAATLYMAVTGIVFSVLLADIEGQVLTAVPWDNTVLHYIGPIAVVVDWIIDLPRERIAYRTALTWLAFPLVYCAYSMIRGAVVDWYPYPFLDPDEHGYPTIAGTVVALVLFAAALTWVVVGFTGRRTRAWIAQ
jgi:hypothetical protein